MFPIEKFKIVPVVNLHEIKRSVRYWDKAGTADGGAFTVGVLMHWMQDGRFVVGDVRRGQWSALDRERLIKSTAETDKQAVPRHFIWVEQEPGSSGRESAEATIRMLAGWKVRADRVTGNKRIAPSRMPPRSRPGTCFCSPESGTERSSTSTRRFQLASTRIRSMPPAAPSTRSRPDRHTTLRWRGLDDKAMARRRSNNCNN
jgi:hypothetical protein